MSSLRLALKQSLQETGHLLPKEKKKRGAKTRNKDKLSSSSSKDHSSQPRKRGRPPKRPSRTEDDADKAEKGPHDEEGEENEGGFSSENEFSYDSEEESGSEENDSEEEEEEDEDDHEDEEDDITAAVVAESQDKQLDNDPRGNNNNNNNNGEPTMSERDTDDHLTTTKHNSSSTKEDEEMDSEEERRRRQRKLLKKKIKNSAANKIQSQWKKRQGRPSSALSETEEEERKSSKTIEEETETAPSKSAAAEDTTATANSSSNSNSNSNSKESEESEIKGNKQSSADTNETAAPTVEKKKRNSGTVPPPTHDVREWSQRLTEKKSRKNICKGMRVKVRFATKVRREGKIVKKRKWYGGRVSNVTPDGSKIKIKYDDGTSEISQFPDDDVVVDDTDNGQHSQAASASVHRFLPRQARSPTPTPTPTPTPAVVEEKEEEKKEVEEKVEEKEEEKPKEEVVKEDMPTEDSPKDDAPEEEVPKEEEAAKPTESSTAKEKEDDKVAEQIPVEKPQEEKEAQEGEEKEEEETPKEVEKDDTKMEEAPEAPEIKAPTPIPEESKPVPETTKPEADEEKPRSSPATTVDAAAAKPEKETIDPAKPVDHAEAMDTDEPTPKEAKPEAPKEEVAEMKQQEEKPSRSNSQKEEEKLEAKPSKPTLTIRISKAKVLENEKLEKHQGTPMQHKANGSQSSDEELDLDTPVTARKVKSLKVKRKRLSDETSPGGSRHKKRKAEVEEPTPPQDKSTEKTSGAATATEMSNEKPPKSPKKSSMVITIPLKQAQAGDEIPQVPSLTKPRKRKDSPAARGSGRKSPSPKSDSPQPMSQDLGKNGDETTMVRPVSQKAVKADGVESADLEMSTAEQTTKAELGSKGSAFGKKAKANADATTKESLPQTKDTEKAPKAGRKAAQEAKEKMGPKQQDKELAAKKKKKRRRKNGSDEEESDDDERQWVQCDKCQKWRILPSRVEASSLPEVWQCSMNDWDPKHSDCSVAEQTFKQIQKERRRAKKRAKQQRLEQAALEANPADSNHDPKVRGGKSSQNSPKPTRHVLKTGKNSDSESKRASPIPSAGNTSVESGLDSKAEKRGRKGKKDKDKDESKQVEVQRAVAAEEVTPKKPGRKRGRPARNVSVETPRSNATKDDENVEWVQCEKCEKWRKLPPYMAADELPDKWYCSLNTWNEASASCEAAEDKADAHHQEVGVFGNVPQGHVGKYSYRSMIYGSGRKYNRPMSEKARAAESLYQRPQVEDGIPQTSVMYAKSSMFVPRMSNFQKTQVVEKKTTSILDVLAESDLWAELQGVGHAMQLLSNNFSGDPYPAFVTYESLPESIKEQMRKVVLQVLGVYVLSGDELVEEALRFPWESLSGSLSQIRAFINADIVINTLLSLVRDGEVEMTCFKDMSVPMTEWVPRYRRVVRSSPKNLENHGSLKTSKCMKISKPWKQMDDSEGWITGGQ